jgi:hypothetical protein
VDLVTPHHLKAFTKQNVSDAKQIDAKQIMDQSLHIIKWAAEK